MRTESEYTIQSESFQGIYSFEALLKHQGLKFKSKVRQLGPEECYLRMDLTMVISNDMITEVEELLHEIAEKTGVRIE